MDVMTVAAGVESVMRLLQQPKQTLKQSHVDLVREARVRAVALKTFAPVAFAAVATPVSDMHLPIADSRCMQTVFDEVGAQVEREIAVVQDYFSTFSGKLISAINSFVPEAWEAYEEKVLATPVIVRAFILVPQKHYESLGPLARKIDDTIQMAKSVGKGFYDPALAQRCESSLSLFSLLLFFFGFAAAAGKGVTQQKRTNNILKTKVRELPQLGRQHSGVQVRRELCEERVADMRAECHQVEDAHC